jgi:3-isopropylmalate dehydrogenase
MTGPARPRIAVLPGDGIGPEVTAAAIEVLRAVGTFEIDVHPIGAAAIERHGASLPPGTLAACTAADAVLLGAVGTGTAGPGTAGSGDRPERGVLELRAALGLYANLRPVRAHPTLRDASPLRPDLLVGADLVVVRELTGGLYFGRRGRTARDAFDTCVYSADEIRRVSRVAFDLATRRRQRVTSVDKANVLDTSRLWRDVVTELAAREYPGVEVEHLLVDTAAMRLVTEPARFDVLLTENMFGDILSDEAAVIAGSIGLLPSASLPGPARAGTGLFEPVHGSAPDIAGHGVANPLGAILSAALLLRLGLGDADAADAVEQAVRRALECGPRTRDLGGTATTTEVAKAVLVRP